MRSREVKQSHLMDGWLMDGQSWPALESESQENTPRVVVVFLLWGYCLRTSETGQLLGGIQWLKHGPSLGSLPSPTGILLLLF